MTGKLLTATGVSREMRTPHSILVRAIRSGTVAPDFIAGRIQLFKPESVSRIAAKLTTKNTTTNV
jgi:hypothetical protein